MKTEIKITLYLVLGVCFCVFCIVGCEVMCDPTDEVKLKRADLEIQNSEYEFVLDSIDKQSEKELKILLIEKGDKGINPISGYSTRDI